MSYELVDAVNQQCELPKGATDLLILTKFAELVTDPLKPARRIGLERFMVITRLDRRTIQRHLHGLHEAGLLVCIDGDKVKGDRPKLYRLNLPEGFDRDVVNARRSNYYAGKRFHPVFNEENTPPPGGEYCLSPVQSDGAPAPVSGNLTGIRGNLPEIQDKLPEIQDKLPEIQDKLPPYNNIINKNNNNNKNGVVVDDNEVLFVLREAAMATGGTSEAFASLGITSENAAVALQAISYFRKEREFERCNIHTNPVRYLSKVIEQAIKSNGTNLDPGSLKSPPRMNEKDRFLKGFWQDFMFDGHKLNTLGDKVMRELGNELFKKLPHRLTVSEMRERVNEFAARFRRENPEPLTDPAALAAAIRKTIEGLEAPPNSPSGRV